MHEVTRIRALRCAIRLPTGEEQWAERLAALTDDQLRGVALHWIANAIAGLDPESWTLRECHDLMVSLKAMLDRRR